VIHEDENVPMGVGNVLTIASDGILHNAEMLNRAMCEMGFGEKLLRQIKDEAYRAPNCDGISIVAAVRIR
jgi:hypothetical protein